MRDRDAFDGARSSGQMGGTSHAFTSPGQESVLSLPRFAQDAARPPLLTVALSYDFVGKAAAVGNMIVYAGLRWTTGNGSAVAEVDIPAGGTVFTLAGGDGLQVVAYATGGSREQIRVTGQVGWSSATHARAAYRTVRVTLPAGSTVNQPIPAFARSVRLLSEDPVNAINVYFAQVNGAARYTRCYFGDDPAPIVAGSHEFEIVGVPAQTIHSVFELQL